MTEQFAIGAAAGFIAPPAPLRPVPGRLLEEIRVLVSCGSEMDDLRTIAGSAIARIDQMLRVDLRSQYTFTHYDYRLDAPREEPAGDFAARSKQAVRDSAGVIAIVGDTVPPVTHIEIQELLDLRRIGERRELWIYTRRRGASRRTNAAAADPGGPPAVTLAELMDEVKRETRGDHIYHRVTSRLDFQATLIIGILPFLLQRAGPAFGPLVGAGGRS